MTATALVVRDARGGDAARVVEIYNHYIRETVITFELDELTPDDMWARMDGVQRAGRPWLVAELAGRVVGYAYAGVFRERAAYANTVEVTVYLDAEYTGRGVGRALYTELLARVRASGAHVAIGGIALPNAESVGLHEAMGFVKAAHLPEVGWKFDQWIDVGYWHLPLNP